MNTGGEKRQHAPGERPVEQPMPIVTGPGEENYRAWLNELPVAAYICDLNGTITYFNRAAEELWGRQPDLTRTVEQFGEDLIFLSAEDRVPLTVNQISFTSSLRTGRHFQRRLLIERMDGTRSTITVHITPMRGTDRQISGAVNVLIDTSHQSRAAEIQARMAAIVESSEDAIVSKTLDGIIQSWNESAERLFGYTAAEAIGQSVNLIVPENRRLEERSILERLGRGERIAHFETVRVHKDGRELDISLTVSPVRDLYGRVVGASKVARDVTERKQAEQAIVSLKDELTVQLADLRRLHEMSIRLCGMTELQSILEEVLDTAISVENTEFGLLSLWDAESECLRVGACRGFLPEYRPLLQTIQPGQGSCGVSFRQGTRVVIEEADQDPVFEPFRVVLEAHGLKSVYSTPLTARNGQVIGVLSILFRKRHTPTDREQHVIDLCLRQAADFIENARLYAQLRESDRRKDEFIATLAHELRNPLAPISNALQILAMSEKQSPAVEGVRSIMDRQVRHLIRLVDDLLEVSRITRGKIELRKEDVCIATVVETAIETSRPLIKDCGHQLIVSVPSEPLAVHVDPMRISQVLSNVLNNAAKYTDDGGQIQLTVRKEGDYVHVVIRDNGVGISAEMLPRIFDMFLQVDRTRRRSHGGLGIGLTLSRHLVQMHEGASIEARSAGEGQGSEFIIRLPLVATKVAEHSAAPTASGDSGPPPVRTIVVVDDTRAAAHMLSKLLQTMGQTVHTANDAESGLELISKIRPDLVISDIAMPGMDGYELARKIRRDATLSGIRLVALTGYGQESDRQQTRAAGFDNHLVKPVSVDALKSLLLTDADLT